MVGLGVVLTLGVEFVTIKGDIGRMNTVFKFYLQAWFLFGVAAAVGIAGILGRWRSSPRPVLAGWRGIWAGGLALLAASRSSCIPVMATPVKVGHAIRLDAADAGWNGVHAGCRLQGPEQGHSARS